MTKLMHIFLKKEPLCLRDGAQGLLYLESRRSENRGLLLEILVTPNGLMHIVGFY
jgi:hypothetical protein